MERPTDPEMTAIERTDAQEAAASHTTQGHTGEDQGLWGGRGSEERAWARAFTVVFSGRNRQSRVELGLSSLDNFNGLKGVGM